MTKSNLEAIGDRILVQREKAVGVTAGGIVLPDSGKVKPQRGKVLSVGNGRLLETGNRIKPSVEVGDTVIFATYTGTELLDEPEEGLIVMREDEILCRIKRT